MAGKKKGAEKKESIEKKKESNKGKQLIIAEKPQAAAKIAFALADNGAVKKLYGRTVPYYQISKKGKEIIIASAVGHIFSLKQTEKGSGFPLFDIEWKPSFEGNSKINYTKKYYDALKSLGKGVSEFVIACDYDVEGELIGFNVLRFIFDTKKAKRMKFSTLTKSDLLKAYENMTKSPDYGLAYAGETRHKLDWIYGINLSRALMHTIKKAGMFKIMSIGRVQGPALKILADKERKIKKFKPTPYWEIFAKVSSDKNLIEVKYNKRVTKKKEAEIFKKLEGKNGEAKTIKEKKIVEPLHPFDLTTFQIEAYKFLGLSPSKSLATLQKLYLAGLISYPRTSSQKLPTSINYKKIIEKMKEVVPKLVSFVKRKIPVEGKKTDSAHPSIYPTGENPSKIKLEENEKKVYDLIVKRFLNCFCENAEIEDKKIEVKIFEKLFSVKGLQIIKKGWMEVYPVKLKEMELPDVNGKVVVKKIKIEEKETKPPKRFTQASLISELNRHNLGTKGTRAIVIQTLFDRGYIKGKSIEVTELGIKVVEVFEKKAPIILEEELTRKFEGEMKKIQESKKDFIKKEEKIIKEAEKVIKEISKKFKGASSNLGEGLIKGHREAEKRQREENTLIECPVCKKGKLVIKKSRFGFFVACSNYPNCKNTYNLPKNGLIIPSKDEEGNLKMCEKCGFPKLLLIKKGRKPWEFCFNPKCYGKDKKN